MRWLQRMGYSMIKIKRGLDLPITGSPQQHIEAARPVRSVAVLGCDYHGMKPTMSAPASIVSSSNAGVLMPQILMKHCMVRIRKPRCL